MSRGLAITLILFLGLGLLQIVAEIAGIQYFFGIPWILAAIISFLTGTWPGVGTILGIVGAHYGWGWPWISAFILFFGLMATSVVVGIGAGVFGIRRGRLTRTSMPPSRLQALKQESNRVENANFALVEPRSTEPPTAVSSPRGPMGPDPLLSQAEDEAKQEQLEERERHDRLSKWVQGFVRQFKGGSDLQREHLIRLLTEEGLIAEEGEEPQRSMDIGLVENFIAAILEEQDRNEKNGEYDLFKSRLIGTIYPAEEQKSPVHSPERISYAMIQTAETIRDAYAQVVQRKEAGQFRAESRLPASRDKIRAALVLSAFFHKSQGQLDKRLHDAFKICYGLLADFVPDETVELQRKQEELTEAYAGSERKLIQVWLRVEREVRDKGKVGKGQAEELEEAKREAEKERRRVDAGWLLRERMKYEVPREVREQCHREFGRLMAEFEERLKSLEDPSTKAEELALLRQVLLSN